MNLKIGRNDICPCGSGQKYKRCHEGKLFTHQSERFTISAKHKGSTYKLFDLMFHINKKGQSGIFVLFPYHRNANGLLSTTTFPANHKHLKKLSLVPGGKVTSHKVKFSHWADGSVHFSQSGKIFTFGKKQSNPLTAGIGHLFTVHLKGLKGFDANNDQKEYSTKKIDLDVDLLESDDDTIKFVAWWYDYATVHPSNRRFNRNYLFKTDDGKTHWCFALQAPKTHPLSNMVLLLTSGTEFMTKEKGSHLLLVGGFDKKEISKDITKDMQFLSMLYPARNYEKMKQQIGSVDYLKEKDLV